MRKFIICLSVFICLSFLLHAQEFSDYKRYGNCTTATIYDPMSDESGALLFCGSKPIIFSIIQEPTNPDMYIAIQTNGTIIMADSYSLTELQQFENEVKIRVDK